MADQRKTTMPRNGNAMMPLSARDVIKRLCRSQRTPHFEKTLSSSSVYPDYSKGPSTLSLPAWFVEEHGEKFGSSVLLRSASSTKSWTVKLTVCLKNPTTSQVRFAGGWRAFVVSNGLSRGDWLIFALTAKSQFQVYAFCGKSGSPKGFPSQPQRSWSKSSELARKKAQQLREQLAAGGAVYAAAKSNIGLIAETKVFRDSKEKLISASGPSSTPPCRLSFHGNPIESEKARDSSPRDHSSHESDEDLSIELEVMPRHATTHGPAKRTRRDHRLHESDDDLIELEVKPSHATTHGPAQRTRARGHGKRLCSTYSTYSRLQGANNQHFRSSLSD